MQPYIQSTSYTTAASALLTILHFFNPTIPLTKEQEFDIWKKSVNLPTRASSLYALATYAKKCGVLPKVIVERKEYHFPDYRFYRYTKEDIVHASFTDAIHYQKAKQGGVIIEEKEITFGTIQRELEKSSIILLRINTKSLRREKRNTSNYIVVHGFTDNFFHIVDPILGEVSVPKTEMENAFNSLETKKHRDHRMIIFSR
ncbi:hypothetical protein COV17_00880 [Candidatus Woesearchaeota archaeon CG10_big_fil_rev_8_21_14_0_10_36_11]|nr:MAG: hypothetical protein COV17_00880 [Candidatus Woesearchaeota archaeon CG10_big_fil_rev_8_21_14_0_10_36_11]